MQETWRWWLRGVVTYPQRPATYQRLAALQEATFKLTLLDGLLCQWLWLALTAKQHEQHPKLKRQSTRHPHAVVTTTALPTPLAVPPAPASSVPLQAEMFKHTWVDTHSDTQKKADRERTLPRQTLMFSQRDIAQFGVNPRPLLPLPPHTKVMFLPPDWRTDEEQAAEAQREAERLTLTLFLAPEQAGQPTVQLGLPETGRDKEAAYLQVIAAVERHTRMLHAPTGSNMHNLAAFAAAREESERVGLNQDEFWSAVIIGAFRGKSHALREESDSCAPLALSVMKAEPEVAEAGEAASSQEPPPREELPETPPQAEDNGRRVRLAIYLRLVALAETGERDTAAEGVGFLAHLALSVLDAQQYGLRRAEIQAALQIGAYRRHQQHRNAGASDGSQPLPICWVTKADFIQTRLDLAERLQALDAAEVKYLAEHFSDALHESYWLTLEEVLATHFGKPAP
jgi:hypothetical protein